MWKVIVFCFAPFLAKFWLMFKNHYKNRYFSTFSKAKNGKHETIVKRHYLGQGSVIILDQVRCPKLGLLGPSLLQHKNGQLGPNNNPAFFFLHTFFSKQNAETLIL